MKKSRILLTILLSIFILIGVITVYLNISASPRQIILIAVDGMQYDHYTTMLAEGKLPNYRRLIDDGGISTSAQITGHDDTMTAPGNAELHTGLPSSVTGISDNTCAKTIPKGLTIFERLHEYDNDIKLGSIYGKQTCYIPNAILGNAKPIVSWWFDNSNYPQRQYISSTYTDSRDVSTKALEFLNKYKDSPFYLFIYLGVPDGAGHKYGENSVQYDDSIMNTDQALGILLDWIQLNKSKTTIILTADHGWNEGVKEHNIVGADTLTVPMISNDKSVITPTATKKQCSVAPTIYKYFGIDGGDPVKNGCNAMY